ncbi:hypothetical protein SAMN05443575_2051 [Jatrophihabitans endophyticus]|uniref:PknH-like extracellular domain-containing protein n=1 Tax=Jatrophihabitans endophyticus TaxID=1206085 RepID=A0A1M5K451_9ACTN|nr:hypothetical protein SAMN05443575_2051 [Jatrophihabitans endophyticus]
MVATGSACSRSVDGDGALAASTSRTTSSGTAGAQTTGAAPRTHATTGETTAAALRCPAGAITASGAPFCYRLPSGFTDFSTITGYGEEWRYRTLVSVGRHDLVEVLASPIADTSTLSQRELRARFEDTLALRVGTYGFVRVGAVTTTTVAGARAFRQPGRYRTGVRTDNTTIYLGRTVATVACQSQDSPATVRIGCAEVKASLQLVGG